MKLAYPYDEMKVVRKPMFIEKSLCDSIMNYCQMKIEYQDLIRDVCCVDDYSRKLIILTKDFFNERISNEKFSQLYIPFLDEKLKVIKKIKKYNRKIKDECKKEGSYYNVAYKEWISWSIHSIDPEYGSLKYKMFIYNHEIKMCFEDVSMDKKTQITYFHLRHCGDY